MLHWICPECGRECEPKQRDCPSCYPETVAKARIELAAKPVAPTKPASQGEKLSPANAAVLGAAPRTSQASGEAMGAKRVEAVASAPAVSTGQISNPVEGPGGVRVLSVRITAVEQRPGSAEAPPGIPVDQSLSILSRHVTESRLGRMDATVAARWSADQDSVRRAAEEEVQRGLEEEARRAVEHARLRLEAEAAALAEAARRQAGQLARIEADEQVHLKADEAKRIEVEAELKAAQEARRRAEDEAKRQAAEEGKRQAEEEAKRKAEEEAKRRAEEEAKRKAEEEAKRKAEEEAQRKAEEEAQRKAEEEAKRKAEEEAKRKADEEAMRKAEEEAKRKAEEEARVRTEAEAIRKAEEEAMRQAQAIRIAEDEARRRAADQEAKRRAEESLRRLADEARQKAGEVQRRAESETRRRAEEARHAQEETRRKAVEYQRSHQLVTTPGQFLVSRLVPRQQGQQAPNDGVDLDRSFSELFESGPPVRHSRGKAYKADPAGTIEFLCPIVEMPAPPFQKLIALPLAAPRPMVSKSASRYRSAPPEFRPSLPVLPPQLQHFKSSAIIPSVFYASCNKGRRAMPGWLMTGLAAFLMVITGIAILNYVLPAKTAAAGQPRPAHQPVAAQAPETPSLPKRLVELTGFRLHPDRSGKTSVQYVVINHGDTEMRGLTAHIVLRSATAKPFQAPVANFTVRLPSMAALESKDLTTLVETPVDRGVPDWTELRAEVRVEQ